jgi:anti-anti-sigma factor
MTHRRQHKAPHTPGFEMHEQRDERGAVRLSLSGELDLAVAHLLRSRLQQLAHAHATVILDLSDLRFINSTGLQILITNFDEATHNGWQLRIDPNLTRPVQRAVKLVGLGHILWPCERNSTLRFARHA